MLSCGEVLCGSCQSYLMGAGGVRGMCHAGCGLCAPAARGDGESGAGDTGDTYLKQHDAICPSRRRPLFPISGTMLRLKQHDAPEDVEYYLCGPPMMAKTVLDLQHSLGVDDADIRFDNFWG